jgi:hypothetical protein
MVFGALKLNSRRLAKILTSTLSYRTPHIETYLKFNLDNFCNSFR